MLSPANPVFPLQGIAPPHNLGTGFACKEGCAQTGPSQNLGWKGPLAVNWWQDVHALAVQLTGCSELPVIFALGGGTDKDTNNLSNYSCPNQFAALSAPFSLWSQYQH